jgi:uncharacterized protein
VAYSAIAYAAYFAGPRDPTGDPLYRYGTAIAGGIVFAFLLGLAAAIAGARNGPARKLLALRRPNSWKLAAGLGAIVLLGTYALAGILGVVLGLDPGAEQGLLPSEWRPERAAQYAVNFIVIATFVPVVEELLFRGVGYSLLRPFGAPVAIVGSAIAFAAAHGLVEAFPLLAAFAVGLAYIRERTGSVYPCIVLHGLFNGIAMLAVFVQAAT